MDKYREIKYIHSTNNEKRRIKTLDFNNQIKWNICFVQLWEFHQANGYNLITLHKHAYIYV